MSTHSIAVSGPDPRLAMLRALILKAAQRVGQFVTTVKVTLTRGTQVVCTAASAVLALIGSEAGFKAVRHAVRTVVTTAARAVTAGLRLLGRGLRFLGRLTHNAIALVSPEAAQVVEGNVQRWIIVPVTQVVSTIGAWVRNATEAFWQLTDHALVRAVTVRAAQAAGVILAIHTISQGAVASRIVQALPWLMDAVMWLTSPVKALILVSAAFVTALGITAARLLDRGTDPNPDEPAQAVEPLVDSGMQVLVAEPRAGSQPAYDLERIAAQVNVEVTPDGSVLVYGIPMGLPEEVGHRVAKVAADAATARLEKVLMHRPVPNRDDKRLLTKTAREALRAEGRRMARSTA